MLEDYFALYVVDKCPFCVNAIELLEESGHAFTVTNLEKNINLLDKIKEENSWKTVPIVKLVTHEECKCGSTLSKGKLIGGYTELKEYLDGKKD